MENLRIGIIGNIGAGKSTLIKMIKSEPYLSKILLDVWPDKGQGEDIHTFPESFDKEVLDAFYQDPEGNAFTLQVEFFNGRLARQQEIEQARGIVLEDRTIFEDYHVFGKAQKILGRLSHAEYIAYQRNYNLMTEKIAQPDIVVYLRADTDALITRIKQRGLQSEQSIPPDYLALLNTLYEEFIARHVHCPVLVIDTEQSENLSEYLESICLRIRDRIRELDLRVTTPGLKDWVSLPQTDAALRAIDAERRLEDYLKQNQKLITVAGNVGLGKSTVTALMHRSLRIEALYENPLKNPLLEKFLHDKKTHCFELQRHFLNMRAAQRRRGKSGDASFVKDRSLAEDLLVFCQQFYVDGHLTASELDMLTTEFRRVSRALPSADLMIVLQARPELAWERIQQRGRVMEMKGGWTYQEIASLAGFYKNYAEEVRKFGFHNKPIIEVNVNKLDLANRIHMGYLFELVYDALTTDKSMKVESDAFVEVA